MDNSRKVVVVTGVCGGIGASVAELLKDDGYIVAGFDIREPDDHESSVHMFF